MTWGRGWGLVVVAHTLTLLWEAFLMSYKRANNEHGEQWRERASEKSNWIVNTEQILSIRSTGLANVMDNGCISAVYLIAVKRVYFSWVAFFHLSLSLYCALFTVVVFCTLSVHVVYCCVIVCVVRILLYVLDNFTFIARVGVSTNTEIMHDSWTELVPYAMKCSFSFFPIWIAQNPTHIDI